MELGIDDEKETLQSLIRSCLLELNELKMELTELEVERANDNTPLRIKELEKDIVEKEKEVSVIRFRAEDEINTLKKEIEEKDILIKNQEDRIYELDYVNNSLDEIKEYFAEQLREYKKKELADVNERLNEAYKLVAEKEAQINSLSRTIDDYKIKVIRLESDVESQTRIMELEKEIELRDNELRIKESEVAQREHELEVLKQQTIPKDEYISLQTQFESELNAMSNEITNLKQETIPKKEYDELKSRFDTEIKSLDDQIANLKESTVPKEDYDSLQNRFDTEISARNSELEYLKERSVSKEEYVSLQSQMQSEINSKDTEIRSLDNQISNLKESTVPKADYVSLQNRFDTEISARNNELEYLKERSVPKEEYVSLQSQMQSEINSKDIEIRHLREQTVPREDYVRLQDEVHRKDDKIRRLEEVNGFFTDLYEEQEAYETPERTPPFRLEKKQRR